jgi:hypothetical protein
VRARAWPAHPIIRWFQADEATSPLTIYGRRSGALATRQRPAAETPRHDHDAFVLLQREHLELKKHCASLEELIRTYACVINELTLENEALREQATASHGTVTPLPRLPPR